MILTQPKQYIAHVERDNSLLIISTRLHDDGTIDIGRSYMQVGVKTRDTSKHIWKMECKNTECFIGLYEKICEAVHAQAADPIHHY